MTVVHYSSSFRLESVHIECGSISCHGVTVTLRRWGREGVFGSLRVVGIEPGSVHVLKDCSGEAEQ